MRTFLLSQSLVSWDMGVPLSGWGVSGRSHDPGDPADHQRVGGLRSRLVLGDGDPLAGLVEVRRDVQECELGPLVDAVVDVLAGDGAGDGLHGGPLSLRV